MAPETSGRQLAALAAALAVVVLVGWWWLAREPAAVAPAGADRGAPPKISIDDAAAGADGSRIVVHVAGAVRRPGVYRLRPGARVVDAVERAGGAARRAELSGLNLAAKVEDARQVLVPERAPPGTVGVGATGAAGAAAGPVNLNTATLEQLDTLDGVGPATAAKIVAYREANNGFGSVDELGEVPGIGAKRLAALRDLVGV